MKRLALALLGALTLGTGLAAVPEMARADEPSLGSWRSPPARGSARAAYRPRRIVRTVVRERPVYVYRTRRVVREVVVERPVFVRRRPIYDEVFVEGPYGPPPPYFRPPPFRPRPVIAYGPGFGPGPFAPSGPRRFGWGWGAGPFF